MNQTSSVVSRTRDYYNSSKVLSFQQLVYKAATIATSVYIKGRNPFMTQCMQLLKKWLRRFRLLHPALSWI
ncbi:MAG: hypothetical protein D3914_00285 [Candidatus Electrothrix sp. LOE2]|nr:hypothetical protein [Candidatus Electrothrix sp. LOE2]